MGRSTRRAALLVCLIELLCFHDGGGLSAGCSGSGRHCLSDAGLHARRGSRIRGRYRSVARQVSHGVFPSVARTPLPPGGGNGVYEGEKNEKEKKEESDFNRGVGKVIDTLRIDYPTLLDEPLDFDIYTPDVQLRDPSGVVLTGLPAYKRMFAMFRFARKTFVHDVSTEFRLSYDGSRQQVRVTWHFILDATPLVARPVHLDGTSVYSLSTQGLVRRHDVETIIVNGTPVKPPFAKAWMQLPSWVTQGLKKGGPAGRAVPGRAPGLTSSTGGGVMSIGGGSSSEAVWSSVVSDEGGVVGRGGVAGRGAASGPNWSTTRVGSGERMLPMAIGGAWGAAAAGGDGGGGTALAFRGLAAVAAENLSRIRATATSEPMAEAVETRRDGKKKSDASSSSGSVWKTATEPVGGGSEHAEGEAGTSSPVDGGTGEAGRSNERDDEDGSSGKEDNKKNGRKKRKRKNKEFWPIEYDGPLACETSFDCTGGYVCCDFIVVKICCSNGVMQRKPGDLIPSMIPIPGRGRTKLDQCLP